MINKLGKNELKILKILWKQSPLLVSEIVELDETLKVPTVQRIINKLQKEKIVEVADIVQSGKVLARRYRPVLKAEDYMVEEIKDCIPVVKNKPKFYKNFVAALLNGTEDDKDTIEELENYLRQKKEEIDKN